MAKGEEGAAVNRLVDAVYVLSVRSFRERIAHIERELGRHDIGFEFIFDYDADAIPETLLAERFAPNDMKRAHQSLVLKHIETWRRCVDRGHRRVLVFEDDAVLGGDFGPGLAAALHEAERLAPGWLIYLGRGDNRVVGEGSDSALAPGGQLPATDALVFDREAARLRLDWLLTHKITRPADWLLREVDAQIGVRHYWLRAPLVEQGSMSGLFESVLDDRRRARGRWYSWARYRWDKWWKRLRRDLLSRPTT